MKFRISLTFNINMQLLKNGGSLQGFNWPLNQVILFGFWGCENNVPSLKDQTPIMKSLGLNTSKLWAGNSLPHISPSFRRHLSCLKEPLMELSYIRNAQKFTEAEVSVNRLNIYMGLFCPVFCLVAYVFVYLVHTTTLLWFTSAKHLL